ncbi:MFS transporter [Carboxydothermus ferrireducens]|uniref:MFS family permease n=1 Tax=Carboxydothermus ferrireducens DSM 11255 TaxID=1119529 RepID=A0ABX2RAY9_9THEO|nr:MFS transporter [Carboxydothermus ferrireducens]NYE57238.1 MFS family permease [Carboxydothermus ferrireducens DSM 11255]
MQKDKPQKKFWGLSQNAFLFGFISMLNDFSSELTLRTLPLFLSNVLGIKTEIIGLIEGIADTTSTLLKLISGYLSDIVKKRKALVFLGYALSNLSRPFLYWTTTWPVVLLIRFLDRVGKGVRTSPKDALIADSTEPENLGKAFGFNRALDPFGAVLALFIAAAILQWSEATTVSMSREIFQKLIIISTIPGILVLLLLAFFIKEVPPKGEKTVKKFSLSFHELDLRFKKFLVVLILFTLGNSSDAFLILKAKENGMTIVEIFIMLGFFNLISVLVSYPAGALSDKIGRLKLIAGGWIVYALLYLGFAVASNPKIFALLYILYGAYYGITEGVEKAMVADLVPSEKRASAYGLYNAAIGLSALPASLIAGILWDIVNPAAAFYFGSMMALLAVLLLPWALKRN